ncbi:aminotransferase class I/II-fold pyridoxal phosphate-dependent enzyme [Halomonadaceae bacterium KBTZ08]
MAGKTAVNIAASIERAIQSGHLSGGDALPSVREAAVLLGVNRNTVTQAYARLRERGWVYGRGRGGTRVMPLQEEGDALCGASVFPGTVDLASGNIDPALLPPLNRAVASVDWQQTGYDRAGEDPELLGLFRDTLAREGIPTDAMMLGHSALDLIERGLRARAQAGDRVLVEDPAWPPLLALLRSLGLVVEPVPLDDQGAMPAQLADRIGGDVAAIVLTPRAQNPTGIDLPAERLERIQGVLREHPRTLLILDDHWGPLSEAPPPVIGSGLPAWLLVRSVSKFLGPDLRLAVAAGDADTVHRMARQFSLGPRWVSRMVQRVAVALLRDAHTETQLQAARSTYTQRRTALVEALQKQGFPGTTGSGINLWVPVKNEAAMVERMTSRGYTVQAGQPFRLRAAPGVRLSVGNLPAEEAEAVAQALAASTLGASTPMV